MSHPIQTQVPRISSIWKHDSGKEYEVCFFTNEYTTQPDRYPVTVVYKDSEGKLWSRPLSDWNRSMTFVKDPE